MSRHDDRVRLRHMLDYAKEAAEMIHGRTREDLEDDRQLNLALVRLLEVAGEAASRITSETRKAYADIPWHRIIGLRNRLIHGYDDMDFDILWDILIYDLPKLILELEKILDNMDKEEDI